jgi:hypothetical protein
MVALLDYKDKLAEFAATLTEKQRQAGKSHLRTYLAIKAKFQIMS